MALFCRGLSTSLTPEPPTTSGTVSTLKCYAGFLAPKAVPEREILTPKRHDEHPRPFHMGVPPPPPRIFLPVIDCTFSQSRGGKGDYSGDILWEPVGAAVHRDRGGHDAWGPALLHCLEQEARRHQTRQRTKVRHGCRYGRHAWQWHGGYVISLPLSAFIDFLTHKTSAQPTPLVHFSHWSAVITQNARALSKNCSNAYVATGSYWRKSIAFHARYKPLERGLAFSSWYKHLFWRPNR